MKATLEVGKTYLINHSRKGKFCGTVTSINDEWADVTVTSGKAKAMLSYNECGPGEALTIRRSFCTFTPLDAEKGNAA